MSKQWKWTLAAVVVLALTVTAPQAEIGSSGSDEAGASGAIVSQLSLWGLRVDSDEWDRPVVTLEADASLDVETFVLEDPHRLVLDFEGAVIRLDRRLYPVDQAGVLQIRAAQHRLEPSPLTRVVFDLEQPVAYEVSRLGSSVAVVFGESGSHTAPVEPVAAVAEPPPTAEVEDVAVVEPPSTPEPTVEEIVEELSQRVPEPQPEELPQPEQPAAAQATAALPRPAAEQPKGRSVDPSEIERLLHTPAYAAPQQESAPSSSFESRRIVTDRVTYRGKRISLNLVDADIKQVFRLFHEISGLNFVLDPNVSGRVTIVLDQVPWDQALDIILKNNGLDKVLENNVLRIATTEKLAQEAAARKRLKEAEELEVEPITLTRTLSYAKSRDVQRVIREGGILSNRGKVIVDERTNTLIVSDIPKKVEPLDALINTLDSETPQVMIEARIVETSKNYSRDLGVVWDVAAVADASRGTSTGLSFPHNASARYALNLPGEGGASNLGFSFGNIVDSFTLDLALNALETEGRGRIISAPKIATQNNERAEIEQGVRIPVTNTTATEIQVEFVSASLLLAVTPQITAEGTIVLDVTVENNSPDFVNTAGGIPSIRTQRAQTKVLISDGGTTVIGGIFVVNEGDSEVGVPWFRKLPVFGWLFRNQSIQKENRELLIFITPKIVKLG